MISKDTVEKVAKLARVEITEEEKEKYEKNLNNIFKYMEILQEVNTDDVRETNQVTGLFSITQEDEINYEKPKREELLNCSKQEKTNNQIKVKKTIN